MEEDTIKKLKEQHFNNYKNSVLDVLEYNTNILVNEDIKSLISKPPLDSMDVLKNKFLDLSKKNNLILNDTELSKLINDYRKDLSKCLDRIKDMRIKKLSKKVDSYKENDKELLCFYKKDFNTLDKELKKILKTQLVDSYEKIILKNINKVFDKNVDEEIRNKIIEDIEKFINKNYHKQVLESFDIKILVKDTILINSVNEQNERYLFTLNNSRILALE